MPPGRSFEELFTSPPFCVLERADRLLLSGIVGRIWTLRRDYPRLASPLEYREWAQAGTAKVLFAHWVAEAEDGTCAVHSESRVQVFGTQGRLGLASVRPLITTFQHLVGTDALATAVRQAERP